MKQHRNNPERKRSNSGRVWVGVIIIFIGFSLLSRTLGIMNLFPDWLFSWPTWLIVIGLFIGVNSNFKSVPAAILMLIGGFALANRVVHADLSGFFWPAMIILLGFWLISGRKSKNRPIHPNDLEPEPKTKNEFDWDRRVFDTENQEEETKHENFSAENPVSSETGFSDIDEDSPNEEHDAFAEDYIDSVSVFGQVKKNIVSQNFRGGDIVNICGGADINLMNADIRGVVVLDVVQLFGGTNIIVPAHWKVVPEMTAIFGGIEDKRFIQGIHLDPKKVLVIKGSSIFGGITIKAR